MITYAFLAFVGLATAIALVDWRRGWYLAILIGVLQDPIRKITPGTPAWMNLAAVPVYLALLLGSVPILQRAAADVEQRYARLKVLLAGFFIFLGIAALNGLFTFGLEQWKAPVLALFLYCIPLPAVLSGYAFVRREEDLLKVMRFYATVTSIALLSVPLEYFRFNSRMLGTVALGDDWIRHLPGLQIRLLSGIYRGPDIMAWHAAVLCIVALTMIVRNGLPRAWIWVPIAGWGFLNSLISGRRKMFYMILLFALVFLWRHFRRLTIPQIVAMLVTGVALWLVADYLSGTQETQVYTAGARTSRGEILQRLEGGFIGAVKQHGLMGAGLGTATQGTRHVLRPDQAVGWQEGGVGKLTVELGVFGFLFTIYFAIVLIRTMMRIVATRPKERTYVLRAALFGLIVANIAAFIASHQPFSDVLLVLLPSFFAGALLAMPRLFDAEAQVQEAPVAVRRPLTMVPSGARPA